MQITREVERVSAIDAESFRARFEHLDTPVVLAGAAGDWPALRTFQLPNLRQTLGHIRSQFKVSSSNAHPDFRQQTLAEMFARRAATFDEFFDAITQGPREERCRWLFTGDEQFLLQRRQGVTKVHVPFQPLLAATILPELIPDDRLYTVWVWFSGAGVRTWLHYDNNGCHNLNAQITGSKQCLLIPPSEQGRLAPFALGGQNPAYNCSQIDVERPDLERFPDYAGVEAHLASLTAGDILFIPAFWFHTFLHQGEFNSNVNFWWKPERPSWNAVARRQVLLEATAAAGIDPRSDAAAAAVLERLDRATLSG